MLNKNFRAFTLAEIMIVFTVIGILTAILLPTLFQSAPDQEELKAKKAFNTISRAVDNLTNSSTYELTGGILESTQYISNTDAAGNAVADASLMRDSFFCSNLANMLNVKSANCTLDFVNRAVATSMDNDYMCAEDYETTTHNNSSPVCIYKNNAGNAEIDADDIDFDGFQNALDNVCEQYFYNAYDQGDPENGYNFITSDGVYWGVQLTNFSNRETVTVDGVQTPLNYGVICFNTDRGQTSDYTFGVAIRRDGKILIGTKLQNILDEDYTEVFNE